MTKIFGIRHHGPGSAQRLIEALKKFQPECILIETPEDAQAVLKYAGHKKLKPPVAILVYNPKDFEQAAFYPFAKFSPEWQAIKFGLKKKVPVQFIDLPHSIQFCLKEEKIPSATNDFDRTSIYDPLFHLAKIAGYEDSEQWWDVFFEQVEDSEEVFDLISEMMGSLRKEINRPEDYETLLREANMREHIRKAQKKHKKIAVVCGAWHNSALENIDQFKSSDDKKLLKGLAKVKCDYTWIPWTYERLSRASGYSAGVISPAWYEVLFDKKKNASIRWLSKAARLLRKKDLAASPANIVEAVNLAHNLAAIRDKGIPGIDELKEAALSTFCNGEEVKYKMIENKLIIGDVVGKVPKKIPSVPLQKDLEKSIKSARLSKEYNSSEKITKVLDLRKENGLKGSKLIHRLNLIEIPWGKAMKGSRFATGSFKETWKLKWRPEYLIRIIEANMWGNTVVEAAEKFVKENIGKTKKLSQLTKVLQNILKADLPKAINKVLAAIQAKAVLESDTSELLDAIPTLVESFRYGNNRGIKTNQIEIIFQQVIPRIFIALPSVCTNIDIDKADKIYDKIIKFNLALNILEEKEYLSEWKICLKKMAEEENINPKIRAQATRYLFDQKEYSLETTSTRMQFELSKAEKTMYKAYWLEGFLQGSAAVLIHNPQFWNLLDKWVTEVKMQYFKEVVPILRRTFSAFSSNEKRKMMHYVLNGRRNIQADKKSLNKERVAIIMPTLQKLLALKL